MVVKNTLTAEKVLDCEALQDERFTKNGTPERDCFFLYFAALTGNFFTVFARRGYKFFLFNVYSHI